MAWLLVSAANAAPSTVRSLPLQQASAAAHIAVRWAREIRRIPYCLATLAAIWEAMSTAGPPDWLKAHVTMSMATLLRTVSARWQAHPSLPSWTWEVLSVPLSLVRSPTVHTVSGWPG
jgi:hypothetical protein